MENKLKGHVCIKEVLKMLWVCTMIGAQMFGSGMAVIPILQKELIEKRKWITEEELLDVISIAKCMPGAYTVNVLALVGNKICGFWGGAAAATGVTLVPIVFIIVFTILYSNIRDIKEVKNALAGIIVCVAALIINSIINLFKKAVIDKGTLIIFLLSFTLYLFTDIQIALLILGMGILYFSAVKFLEKNEVKNR